MLSLKHKNTITNKKAEIRYFDNKIKKYLKIGNKTFPFFNLPKEENLMREWGTIKNRHMVILYM